MATYDSFNKVSLTIGGVLLNQVGKPVVLNDFHGKPDNYLFRVDRNCISMFLTGGVAEWQKEPITIEASPI